MKMTWREAIRSWPLCIASIALFAVLLVSLITAQRRSDVDLATAQAHLVDLRQIDARWSADILSLELGLNPNYDPVAAPVGRIMNTIHAMEALSQGNSPVAQALAGPLSALSADVDRKVQMAERLKSNYAILSNSSRLLPIAATELVTAGRLADDGPGRDMAELLMPIVANVASYMVTPDDDIRRALGNAMNALRETTATLSPAIAEKVQTVLAHAELIATQRQLGSRLLVGLTGVPTARDLDTLQTALQQLAGREAAHQRLLRDAAIFCGLLLALALGWLVVLLRQRYRSLDADKTALQQVNDEVQAQLIQSAKLSAMGQMVAGITHEINTPLAYVKAVFALIKEQLANVRFAPPPPDAVGETASLEEINMLLDDGLHGIEEIALLVKTMKNFSRLDRGRVESFDVQDALDSTLLIAKSELKYVADVVKDYGDLPLISASPSQIKQVFLNLINNAAQAMATPDRRGILTVRTRRHGSDRVRIEIKDNGQGIPSDVLPKIFDPFFTTKDIGEGSGMGLSICYRIVENHGGTISVDSAVGAGTTFTIELPCSQAAAPAPRAEPIPHAA